MSRYNSPPRPAGATAHAPLLRSLLRSAVGANGGHAHALAYSVDSVTLLATSTSRPPYDAPLRVAPGDGDARVAEARRGYDRRPGYWPGWRGGAGALGDTLYLGVAVEQVVRSVNNLEEELHAVCVCVCVCVHARAC